VFIIMTDQSMQFRSTQQFMRVTAVSICLGLLSGCASNTIDQAVPISNVTEPLQTPQQPATASTGQAQVSPSTLSQAPTAQPKNTGQFPNINVVPTGEIAQLSDAETAATRARLEGEAQVQQQRGESPDAYLERLRKLQKLGSTHAAATLRQIEQGQ
jgi:hypothetical protein